MMKMNILHVINTMDLGGAQTLLLNSVEKHDMERFDISIAYIQGKGTAFAADELPADVRIFDLSSHGRFTPFSLFRLVRLIRKNKIDIVHTHLVHAGILGKLAAMLAGVKKIVTTRHYGYSNKQDTFLYRLEEKLTRRACIVVAISEAVRDYLLDRHVTSESKIRIIHNSIDMERVDPTLVEAEPRLEGEELIFGTVGRLHPAKGFDILLNSLPLVLKSLPKVRTEIVGEGELREELQALARKLNVHKNVSFLGALGQPQVLKRLKKWDLFVMPSLWEGFGISILEAMAMQKAVVSTNVDGIVEIVEDGVTGFLTTPADSEELADRIVGLLRNPDKRNMMGEAGRKRVAEHFRLSEAVTRLEDVYESLVR